MRKKILIGLAVLAILYFLFLRKKVQKKLGNESLNDLNSSSYSGSGNNTGYVDTNTRVLSRGDSGTYVKQLQKDMNSYVDIWWTIGLEKIAEDGVFGIQTENLLNDLTGLKMIALEGPNYSYQSETLAANFNPLEGLSS